MKNPLEEERVIRAYEFLCPSETSCISIKGDSPVILEYPEVIAFRMRDACDPVQWLNKLEFVFEGCNNGDLKHDAVFYLAHTTPKHWIVAAAIAWEESQK